MIAPIRSDHALVTPSPMACTTQGPVQQESFRQTISQILTADICLQTEEGDTVTLSGVNRSQEMFTEKNTLTPTSASSERLMASARQSGLAVSVQGSLSEEEIADIRDLMTDLTSISTAFFSGDYQSAMEQAVGIGDMGSISSLSASFSSHTSIRQTLATTGHPLPDNMGKMAEVQSLANELPAPAADYGEWLRTRWEELLDSLHTEKEASAAPPPGGSPAETATRMMERMQRTIAQHPRLTPFAEPLADRAMRKGVLAASPLEKNHAATASAFRSLRGAFTDHWQQWLHGTPETQNAPAGQSASA